MKGNMSEWPLSISTLDSPISDDHPSVRICTFMASTIWALEAIIFVFHRNLLRTGERNVFNQENRLARDEGDGGLLVGNGGESLSWLFS